jgi:hypothetical protein
VIRALLMTALAVFAAETPPERPKQSETPREDGDARPAGAPLEASLVRGTDEHTLLALERGLAFLSAQQALQQDGSLPRAGGKRHVPVPTTALAALAFMACGSSPERGPYGHEVSMAVDYLALRADLSPGSKAHGFISFEGDELSRMHGHGFATLALTQAYAVSPRTTRGRRLETVLRAAIDRIEASQGLEGGWFYDATVSTEHENSVTVCLVQALRAARDLGFQIDTAVIEQAVDYIRRCQAEDGSFKYGLETDETTLALTAAGLSTLNFLGQYDGPEVERGMEVLWQRLEMRRDGRRGSDADFPYYERLYVALALWQHSDRRLFDAWMADEQVEILNEQRADGSWNSKQFGSCYATAMNCLVLALPQGLLPIFQR